ncbi:MAG: ISKra4 family transposase [Pseudonocardiales bacterium]|nr:MAG: ISKra4 family transposase [Pseudonocardiales bacterium]
MSATLAEGVARLGTKMPFAQAVAELAFFWGVELDATTVRRHTEAAGAAYVAEQTAEVERLERERPAAPAGPTVQYLSADGAMVPLVGGQWAEVKTLAIGEVEVGRDADGLPEAHTTNLTYFSRLADAETFTRQAYVETYQRGTESASVVCAVQDGAEWLQGLVDVLRPDAVRILDFPHAVEHLTGAAQPVLGKGTPAFTAWLDQQAHTLKHAADGARQVLTALARLPVHVAVDPIVAAEARNGALAYFTKRLVQVQYATFQVAGYPIGSGSTESANKVVVEARLKGSGMHWARTNVNPLLALRTVACTDCWANVWPRISARLRADAEQHRRARWRARHPTPTPPRTELPPSPAMPIAQLATAQATLVPRGKSVVNGRPTAFHPWKRYNCLSGGQRTQRSSS